MATKDGDTRWRTDGKFFRTGGTRIRMNAVTYGPFPGGLPNPPDEDFAKIAAAGFNALRLYEMPDKGLLDAAARQGLAVFAGLQWRQNSDFLHSPGHYTAVVVQLAEALRQIGHHPALAGIYVANEIPPDLVRWMGPLKVRKALEGLIEIGREIAPQLLFAYANFPSTEYLEPENADFTAFNIYLEDEPAFRDYLRRLHHIAGDRPLVVSEFGMDSRRNGLEKQAATLRWASRAAVDMETAGMTLYAWSDRWFSGGAEVTDWDFGLIDRQGHAKPSLAAARPTAETPAPAQLSFSVIVCTRNGRQRIAACLRALEKSHQSYQNFETLVVDDGSTDGCAEYVAQHFPEVRLIRLKPCGLSAARNAGAAASIGQVLAFTDDDCQPDREWLARLHTVFLQGEFSSVGGPNLPPPPSDWEQAVVCAAPGAPSHVMLDDREAEHLPGCNLAVTRAAFQEIGGFDPRFHTAGDDVDFCWRLRDAGHRLGFAPAAFVWHWRRPSLRAFLRQQLGYGRAEKSLLEKHPLRFSRHGGPRWDGFVYGGGPVRVMADSIIYHGPLGDAGYQGIVNRMLPLRGLVKRFDTPLARASLAAMRFLQPRLRAWARNHDLIGPSLRLPRGRLHSQTDEFFLDSAQGLDRTHFLKHLIALKWEPCAETSRWDLQRGHARVMMATERGDGQSTRTLVRVAGIPVTQVKRALAQPLVSTRRPRQIPPDERRRITSRR